MCKEIWIQCYESTIEDICDQFEVEGEVGEKILDLILSSNPGYIENNLSWDG